MVFGFSFVKFMAFYHFSVILIHFYWLFYWILFWDSLFQCFAFCGNQIFDFYWDSTDWLPCDEGSGCGESWNSLQTAFHMCICVCLYVCGYMYVCMCMCMCMCMCIYICVYVCIYVYVCVLHIYMLYVAPSQVFFEYVSR